jgi:hypothetical protein
MLHEKMEALTQDGLIVELHKQDYNEITKRRIIDWRENDLLPPFDLVGGGRGKGSGRKCNSWSDGQRVIRQALWVWKLLQIYRGFDNLYLPLWMLGCEIPIWRVREALSEPLHKITGAIEADASMPGEFEDIIDDAAYEYSLGMELTEPESLRIPKEALEALINIFFNPEYNLNDYPFERGAETLKEWEHKFHHRNASAEMNKGIDTIPSTQNESANNLFDHAAFFKEYLSVHQFKMAVDECANDDLLCVEHDLRIVREMAFSIHKMILILAQDLPAEFKEMPGLEVVSAKFMAVIFAVGRLIVLADLSLRRNGFAEVIDRHMPEVLFWFRQEVNERLEIQLAEVSPKFAIAMKTNFERMKEVLASRP